MGYVTPSKKRPVNNGEPLNLRQMVRVGTFVSRVMNAWRGGPLVRAEEVWCHAYQDLCEFYKKNVKGMTRQDLCEEADLVASTALLLAEFRGFPHMRDSFLDVQREYCWGQAGRIYNAKIRAERERFDVATPEEKLSELRKTVSDANAVVRRCEFRVVKGRKRRKPNVRNGPRLFR